MNRPYRELTTQEMISVLNAAEFCWLGTMDHAYPYMVPMCFTFSYQKGSFTFLMQSKAEGKKMDCMEENPHVMISVDTETETGIQTVLAMGKAKMVPPACRCRNKMDIEVMVRAISGREYARPVCGAARLTEPEEAPRIDWDDEPEQPRRNDPPPRHEDWQSHYEEDRYEHDVREEQRERDDRNDRYERYERETQQDRYDRYDRHEHHEHHEHDCHPKPPCPPPHPPKPPCPPPKPPKPPCPPPHPPKPPRPEPCDHCASEHRMDTLWRRYAEARRECVALRLEQTTMCRLGKEERMKDFDRVRTSDVASYNDKTGVMTFRKNGIYRLLAAAGAENPDRDGDRLCLALWNLNETCLVDRMRFKPAGCEEYQLDDRLVFEVNDRMYAFVLKNASTDAIRVKGEFLFEKIK